MIRSLPLDVQDNIKFLLKSGHSYSYIIKRVPGVKKNTISDYKRRWFPNMGPLNQAASPKLLLQQRPTSDSQSQHARIKKHKPFLKAIHMKKRLAWANAHKDWTKNDWRRIVFSDETKVNVWGSDGVKYYWKRVDDKLRFHHLDLTSWVCLSYL
ncbi:hypothetical protein G6F59_013105 [Rhizopus arrhizus]|nr:hypothetical protein G6F59_013105 [Rhizopus arrhizus]